MQLINKLTAPGGIKRVSLRSDTVRIETRDGRDILYRLVSTVPDTDQIIAGNIRDYWKHQRSGAEH